MTLTEIKAEAHKMGFNLVPQGAKDKKVHNDIHRVIEKVKLKSVEKVMILVAAFMMEELGCDPDKIIELWDGISRYSEAIKQHLITINQVCEIISEHTGMKIHWGD